MASSPSSSERGAHRHHGRAPLRRGFAADSALSPGAGFTALELVLALGMTATIAALAVPVTTGAADEIRTAMAARYLEGRIQDARMHAVQRSARVGLRFEPEGNDYRIAEYLDGNANGIRTAEIGAGIDARLGWAGLLCEHFAKVRFGLQPGVPEVDGARSEDAAEGVRVGSSRILSLGPDGTATSGTLYVQGTRSQYAVRILGATARTRLLRFDRGSGQWMVR